MAIKIAATRSLDSVFERGQIVWQSHPDHLASVATLSGLQPQPADQCRVLELGPSAAVNLPPMADRHPESSFVGVDASAALMQAAQHAANDAGLRNIDFLSRGLAEIDNSFGTFDYIICHDRFSRVSSDEQDRLLDICRARLNPNGIVFASYRAQPGWVVPRILRDLLMARERATVPAEQRVESAKDRLRFISRAAPRDRSPYRALLAHEADLARQLSDAALAHEYFGAENHAFYYHEFAKLAAVHNLQAAGDADLASMFTQGLSRATEEGLAKMAASPVEREQYLDLLCNRAVRRTLLCRNDAKSVQPWSIASLEKLRLAGDLQSEGEPGDCRTHDVVRFTAGGTAAISSAMPAVKIALWELGRAWPASIAFESLANVVAERLAEGAQGGAAFGPAERGELATNLLGCIASGVLRPYLDTDRFVTQFSSRPRASRWTRLQVESGLGVVNRRHEPVALDDLSRNLLRFLDGERDRAALLTVLAEEAVKGNLSVFQGGIPTGQRESTTVILEQVLDQSLNRLARCALLVE
jgi:hypothetical protein